MRTSTTKVAKAREHADAGEYDQAAELQAELAIEDRDGDIGYAERMRWEETFGVLERAGATGKVREALRARRVCS